MTINDLQISLCGVFPEMACAEMEELLHTVQALSAEGLSHLTVSFDPEHFTQQAAAVSGRTPDFSLGAGPLTTEEACRQAIACGAEFVLTTEFTPALVEYGSERKAAIIPICSNCAEAERAMALGCTILRCTVSLDELEGIFRLTEAAEPIVTLLLDGEAAEAALRAPSGKRIICAVWEADSAAKRSSCELSAEIAALQNRLLDFRVAHIGINCENPSACDTFCGLFQNAFGFETVSGGVSNFCSSEIEVLKKVFLGKHGHIAIRTNSVLLAIRVLERRGFQVDMSTAFYVGTVIRTVYLQREFEGFAVHLLQR